MRRLALLCALLALTLAAHHTNAAQDEGDVVSRSELVRELPASADHPVPRIVMAAQEQEISCRPEPKRVLAVHYRAKPTAKFSMNDDQVVIALEKEGQYKILKAFESEAAIVEGLLYSDNDFDQDFITIGDLHFLYVRDNISGSGGIVMHDVYTMSSDDQLSSIPFENVSKSKLLKASEELRNGRYMFKNQHFSFEAGVYKPQDPECCPSNGAYHALFKLEGDFKPVPQTKTFRPDFKFVVAKEWRDEGS